ncbi:beta-ketothiolase BktB [Pontibacterium granulatum]|uniref:beta-ketothiolase BktB n=1 Tax=Pontibacterium granulatum TaxID=2036029 RepID=UPI00249ABD9F|nr:beta-ketothiolase BktB [Pontibacterium granulatum]MDI3324425.1 beta-ketothiolase BktB [Pontibacterium granulatum]
MSNREIVVLSGVRTAIGGFGGSLKSKTPGELAAACVAEAVKRSGAEPEAYGHAVFGNVIHTERQDMYLSRAAAVNGGLPHETPAVTVNRLCGSGLQAIITAAQQIETEQCDAAIAGGAEVMSRSQYWLPSGRFGQRMGDGQIVDAMVGALTCPFDNTHMGITAENIAEKWNISRQDQDALAVMSHNRAEAAIKEGRFKDQILPIEIADRKKTIIFDTDEHTRHGLTMDDVAKMRPAFKKDGSVTAGNASGLNDAAAAVTLMAADVAEAKGLQPMAKLAAYSFAGVEPKYMGIGPVPAVRKLLDKAGLSVADIDVWEVNEAFAAQALAVCRDLELPMDKVNVNGSGISLGHPIGATGAIITVKALYELQRTEGRYAVVTMCIGGGQGIAALFERI